MEPRRLVFPILATVVAAIVLIGGARLWIWRSERIPVRSLSPGGGTAAVPDAGERVSGAVPAEPVRPPPQEILRQTALDAFRDAGLAPESVEVFASASGLRDSLLVVLKGVNQPVYRRAVATTVQLFAWGKSNPDVPFVRVSLVCETPLGRRIETTLRREETLMQVERDKGLEGLLAQHGTDMYRFPEEEIAPAPPGPTSAAASGAAPGALPSGATPAGVSAPPAAPRPSGPSGPGHTASPPRELVPLGAGPRGPSGPTGPPVRID